MKRVALAVWPGAFLALTGCGGPTPTAPASPASQRLVLVFDDPTQELRMRAPAIRAILEDVYRKSERQIPIRGVTVTVTTDLARVIPGWGIGGSAESATRLTLAVDPRYDMALASARLPPMAAHEFHHVARFRGLGYGRTLLEALVSEGLADHFALELLGGDVPPWSRALSAPQLEHWLALARLELDSPTYNHGAWFIGTGQAPPWTGYAIGFDLVARYRATDPSATAASLVHASADVFRP